MVMLDVKTGEVFAMVNTPPTTRTTVANTRVSGCETGW